MTTLSNFFWFFSVKPSLFKNKMNVLLRPTSFLTSALTLQHPSEVTPLQVFITSCKFFVQFNVKTSQDRKVRSHLRVCVCSVSTRRHFLSFSMFPLGNPQERTEMHITRLEVGSHYSYVDDSGSPGIIFVTRKIVRSKFQMICIPSSRLPLMYA